MILEFYKEKQIIDAKKLFEKAIERTKQKELNIEDFREFNKEFQEIDDGLIMRLNLTRPMGLQLRYYGIVIAKYYAD